MDGSAVCSTASTQKTLGPPLEYRLHHLRPMEEYGIYPCPDNFDYVEYPIGNSQIRVLSIEPPSNDGGGTVCCTLEVIDLAAQVGRACDYIALSYVWGNPEPKTLIRIGGLKFPVGPNLYGALVLLQGFPEIKDRRLRVRIDAICIDQVNAAERSQQIKLMPSTRGPR